MIFCYFLYFSQNIRNKSDSSPGSLLFPPSSPGSSSLFSLTFLVLTVLVPGLSRYQSRSRYVLPPGDFAHQLGGLPDLRILHPSGGRGEPRTGLQMFTLRIPVLGLFPMSPNPDLTLSPQEDPPSIPAPPGLPWAISPPL